MSVYNQAVIHDAVVAIESKMPEFFCVGNNYRITEINANTYKLWCDPVYNNEELILKRTNEYECRVVNYLETHLSYQICQGDFFEHHGVFWLTTPFIRDHDYQLNDLRLFTLLEVLKQLHTLYRSHKIELGMPSFAFWTEKRLNEWKENARQVLQELQIKTGIPISTENSEQVLEGIKNSVLLSYAEQYRTLCHGDLNQRHLYFRGTDQITIIDWGEACFGPIFLDVASIFPPPLFATAINFLTGNPPRDHEIQMCRDFQRFHAINYTKVLLHSSPIATNNVASMDSTLKRMMHIIYEDS